ncbi:MAG: indolepyruvate decarboxylase, partial [Comamonadaceae bacterium]
SRRLGLPVVTSFMGRGLLSEQDAPLIGTYMGVAGFPEVTQLVENSDSLFLLGEIICDTNFAVSETKIDMRKTIQALNGQVNIGYHTYAKLPLAAVVNRMLERVDGPDKTFQVTPQVFPANLAEDAQSITPTDIATAVNDLMARHGKMPIASDMGDCLFTAMEIKHTALVAPGYYATMGFGVPAGLGLQAATGERPLTAAATVGTQSCCCSTTPAGKCCALFNPSRASTTWTTGALLKWPQAWAATAYVWEHEPN